MYHTDKVAPVAFLLWLGIEIFGISVVGRQDTGETRRLLAEPDASAAVYEDVVKIVVADNSPGRSGRVVLQVISLKIVDEESVAIAGDIIHTVGRLFYIVSAETLNGSIHSLQKLQDPHVALFGEDVEDACAVADKVVVVIAETFNHSTASYVILFGDGGLSVLGRHHEGLSGGENHPHPVPLETGCHHTEVFHTLCLGCATQFTSVGIEGDYFA